jgi:hypothetical protein
MFSLAGLTLIVTAAVQTLRAALSGRWPTAEGTIISAQVQTRRTRKRGTVHRPFVKYQYQVDGESYTANTLSYGNWYTTIGRSSADEKVKQYPAGSAVQVHYNPRKPAEAILESKSGVAWMLFAMGTVFFLVGIAAALGLI